MDFAAMGRTPLGSALARMIQARDALIVTSYGGVAPVAAERLGAAGAALLEGGYVLANGETVVAPKLLRHGGDLKFHAGRVGAEGVALTSRTGTQIVREPLKQTMIGVDLLTNRAARYRVIDGETADLINRRQNDLWRQWNAGTLAPG